MNSRQKGARGERELAKILQQYGYEARRGQQYCGANGDADVVGLPGFHIECKRVERLDIYAAMGQSENDAKLDELPIVVFRKNGKPWLVVLKLSAFISLIKQIGHKLDPRQLFNTDKKITL